MIDFHTHILPNIDDGAASIEMALAMLEEEVLQGVDTVCLTPHFYADHTSPTRFLDKRQRAYDALVEAVDFDIPELRLGAEVYYFDGFFRMENKERFFLQGTNLLLLEMPFEEWSNRLINEICALARSGDLTLCLAHIERYMPFNHEKLWPYLAEHDVLLHVNADFFNSWSSRHKALSMLRREQIHLLGSDCHNMTSRLPNISKARNVISKRLGEAAVGNLVNRGRDILGVSEE